MSTPLPGTTRAEYQKVVTGLKQQIAYCDSYGYTVLSSCLHKALEHAEKMEA